MAIFRMYPVYPLISTMVEILKSSMVAIYIYIYNLKIIVKNNHTPGCLITEFCYNDQSDISLSQES